MPKKLKTENATLEESLKELEDIAKKMESGKPDLEESVALFEKGILLSKRCETTLLEAKQKVKQLIEHEGKPELSDYEDINDDS